MLTQCGYFDLDMSIEGQRHLLTAAGSQAAPGYMKPEGLVIYAEKAKTYWKVILDK